MSTEVLASEGGHWYFADGKPCESVPLKKPTKDGRTTTSPTLRHAKSGIEIFPSVTTIWKIKSEPGLTKWLIDRALRFGYENHHLPTVEDVIKHYQEFSDKPSDRGTVCHALMEQLIRGEAVAQEDAAVTKAYSYVYGWLQTSSIKVVDNERSFCHPELGWGGKTDFLGELPNGDPIVVDFKFVQKARAALDKECIQGAAYLAGMGIMLFGSFHNILFNESTGELVEHKVWSKEELAWGLDAFLKAYELWVTYNQFDPRKRSRN